MAYDDRYPLKEYLNSINLSKRDLMEEDPGWEKNYPPYVINKCLSSHLDTLAFANEMNRYPNLDKRLQYSFFLNTVRPKKRFSPWGKKEKVKEASNNLMYLLENHSGHKLMPKAQYMLGDIYMNDLRDFNTAIQEYRKVLEKFSGSEQEPHALFMIGYVYANVLNDTKSAKIEYEDFLKRFPKHELSPSVRFEIDYLGKSVDEIPALKHITS